MLHLARAVISDASKGSNGSFSLSFEGSVCKVRTQDPENIDEEVKSLVTVWLVRPLHLHVLLVLVQGPNRLLPDGFK